MNPALPTGRNGRLLALGILLLLVALFWTAAVQPLLGWYGNRAAGLQNLAALVARQATLAAALPRLEQAARRRPDAGPDHAFMDADTDAIAGATLEQQLQTMTGRIGASLSSAEALDPRADGRYHRIALKVTVASDWPTFITLLRTITTGRPEMLVDDLSVTGAAAPVPGVPPISATFTVIAFRDAAVPSGNTAANMNPPAAP